MSSDSKRQWWWGGGDSSMKVQIREMRDGDLEDVNRMIAEFAAENGAVAGFKIRKPVGIIAKSISGGNIVGFAKSAAKVFVPSYLRGRGIEEKLERRFGAPTNNKEEAARIRAKLEYASKKVG